MFFNFKLLYEILKSLENENIYINTIAINCD